MNGRLVGFAMMLFCGANSGYCSIHQAGLPRDPILWEVSRAFVSPIPVGQSDTITYQITNNLPWPMTVPLSIQKIASSDNEFTVVDHCSGQKLQKRDQTDSSCLVTVTLAPLTPGNKSFQLSIGGFSNDEVILTPVVSESFTAARSNAYGMTSLELPPQPLLNSPHPYSFKFLNPTKAELTNPNVNVTATNGSRSVLMNTCNTTIAVGGSCTVSGTYTPTSAGGAVTATLAYNGTSTSVVSSNTGGRVIGYLVGWNTPPSAASIAAAGYTHVMISFGVFSTTNPGTIVTTPITGFDLTSYIRDLHAQGIQALLSIGGASTNIPNTTVNFHEAWTPIGAAPFETNMVASMTSLATTYDFDGFDFDIEQGFSPAATGATITNPGNDIPVLANIITTYRSANPGKLLTLVPQIANISATSGLNNTFGNYSSLIMQTGVAPALSWVGIQLYNAGCAFGIDCNCWDPNTLTTTPDPAVAFVEDLLQSWPSTCPLGQASGFLAYTASLVDSQVALGFPVINGQGISDGSPPAVLSVVKRAVQCLRTQTASSNSCDTYLPNNTYPNIGGVFSWNINNDASNSFQFSTGIYPCAVTGTCT